MNEVRKKLMEAEAKADELFKAIDVTGLVQAGKTEKQLNKEVFDLCYKMFGVKKHWHKRIVRSGPNTLKPYAENPPDLVVQKDDIVFFDFGPLFEEWEADFGRTYVVGYDPHKMKLKNDIEKAWYEGRDWFRTKTKVSGAEMFNYTVALAHKYGWEFGGPIAGHIIGQFPHERLPRGSQGLYIHPKNNNDMLAPDKNGQPRDWILEIHFVDKEKQIGGFFEQLMT